MKKLGFTLLIIVCASFVNGQNAFYDNVIHLIKKNYPHLVIANRLIAVNVWSTDDQASREANLAFDKAMKVYEVAKLEGGSKGFIAVAISLDDMNDKAKAAFKNEGTIKLLLLNQEEFEKNKNAPAHNIVFNASGVIVYQDIKPENVFSAINKLITR